MSKVLLNESAIPGNPMYAKELRGPDICFVRDAASSRGFFFNENPLLKIYNVFALQIILLALAYRLVYYLLRPLKQTKFVCSVLAGVLIGPNMLGNLHVFGERGLFPEREMIITETMGAIAIAYFIFLVAVKMDLTVIRKSAKEAIIIGGLSILVPFVCTFATTTSRPMPGMRKGFFRFLFSSGLSVTRFANVADVVNELDMVASQQGQLVLSSVMIHELFTWFSLVTGICYRLPNNRGLVPIWLILTLIVVGVVGYTIRAMAMKIISKGPKSAPVPEALVTTILVAAGFMAFLTDLVGALHLGMLVMGFIMPDGPPLGSAITDRAEYMVMEFLMPVFYVLVGYNTDLSSINTAQLHTAVVFVVVSFVTKFLATVLGGLACRKGVRCSFLIGLMMSVKGPMDLYLFMRWQQHKDIVRQSHTVLVFSHVAVTAVVTPLIEWLYRAIKSNKVSRRDMRSIQTSSMDEEFKVLCCVHDLDNVPGIASLLEASNGITSSNLTAVIVHLNDLVGRAAPVVARNDKKYRKVDTNLSDKMAYEFENHARRSEKPMELINYTVVAPYKSIHENISHLARSERTTLIILPYQDIQGDTGAADATVVRSTALRSINCNVLCSNPCTVGLLVNKGLGRCIGPGSFSCNVAVIFTGGHDDCEALAYAIRLLMRTSVHVTLLRLYVRSQHEYIEDMLQKKIDDQLVAEFQTKVRETRRAEYYEKYVEDLLSVFNTIRLVGDNYNLVITGRQNPQISWMCYDLLHGQRILTENAELGIIGDFIASEDYTKTKSSALIMQRYPTDANAIRQLRKTNSLSYYEEQCLLGRAV